MSNPILNNAILAVFSFLVLLIIFIKSTGRVINNRTLLRAFQFAIIFNVVALVADIMGRCDGFDKPWFPFFNNVGNFVLFLAGDFLSGTLLIYVTLYVHQEKKIRPWVLIFVGAVCLVKFVLTALSPSLHILYYIDEANVYHRTNGIYASLATSIILMVAILAVIFKNIKKLRLSETLTILSFFIFQGLAIGLQFAFYGVSLIYPASTLAILILYINIQEGQMKNERDILVNINEHDALTNLFSLNKYKSMLASDYKQLSSCGVMYFDINYLKKTNDEYGHAVGDVLIRNCAATLLSITSPTVHGYRLGGDEFMLVAVDISKDDFDALVHKWKDELVEINTKSAVLCSMAMGSAWASGDFSVETLSRISDEKMYVAKREMKGEAGSAT